MQNTGKNHPLYSELISPPFAFNLMLLDSPSTTEAPPPIEAPETVLLHSGMNVQTVFGTFTSGAIFPLTAGLALFGWRAGLAVAAVVFSAMTTAAIWRRIGLRGGQVRIVHMLWLAVVLAMMLPAELMVHRKGPLQVWPILPAAGATLVILNWLLGGLGVGRVHPVLATFLLMVALFPGHLKPNAVLQRHMLFTGDVLDVGPGRPRAGSKDPWITRPLVNGQDALLLPPASEQLQAFTKGSEVSWVSMDALVRDRMPPIQDLIIAGQPGPIGMGSIIAIVTGGLFLLYRGLIDYRIPLLIWLSLGVALYVLPVPIVVADQPVWSWFAIADPRVSWATGMTFVHYEMLASPALFMAIFLATDPSVRPMAKGSRAVYAIVIGVLAAAAQRYLSVAIGPYVALLIGSILTPFLDKALRPKPIV